MQRSAIDSPAAPSRPPVALSAEQALMPSSLQSQQSAPAPAASTLPFASSTLLRPRALAVDITSDEQSSGEGSSDSSTSSSGSEAAALIAQFHTTMSAAPAPVLLKSSSSSAALAAAAVHAAADAVSSHSAATNRPARGSAAAEAASSCGRATPPPPVAVRVKIGGRGSARAAVAGGVGGQALSPRAGRGDAGSLQRLRLRTGGGSSAGTEGGSVPLSARGSAKDN